MRLREILILLAALAAICGFSVIEAQVVRTAIDSPAPVQGSGHVIDDGSAPDAGGQGVSAPPTVAVATYSYTDITGGLITITTPQVGGEATAAWIKRHTDAIKAMQDAFPPKQQQ